MTNLHQWLLAGHLIAIIFWMAALYYLPRLFVYHAQSIERGEPYDIFIQMEARLAHYIMTPAMLMAWGFGISLMLGQNFMSDFGGWFVIKFTSALILTFYHLFLLYCRKGFEKHILVRSSKFFRIFNEIPPLLTILIVIMVLIRPF